MKKKNTIHRLVALLLAVIVCMAVFTGCNPENTESTKPSLSKNTLGMKNVDIYPLESDKTFNVISGGSSDRGQTMVAQKMEEVTGVKVDYTYMSYDQLQMILGGGDFPDAIFMFSGGLDKTTAYQYGESGKLVNFMDYLDIMPNFSAVIKANPEYLEAVRNEDGSVYMLPSINVTSTGSNNLLYYRTDMMEAVGWEAPPKTTDEFLEYIKDLQAHYGAIDRDFVAFNGYQASHMRWDQLRLMNYFFASFGELVKTDLTVNSKGEVVLGAATEQYKHLLEFMHEIWKSGAFNTNIYTQDATGSKALAAGNHVGISTMHTGHTLNNFKSGNFDMDVLAPLTSEYWNTPHWYMASPASLSTTNVISTSCEDIETMVQWFDAWYAPVDNPLNEEGTMFSLTPWLGEIGVDYSFNDETKVFTELEHPGIEYGQFSVTQAWSSCLYSGYENGYFPYSSDPTTGAGVKGHGTVNNLWPYAETPFDLNTLALSEDEMDMYSDVWTDIDAYIVDATAKFITGAKGIETGWAEYLSDLEKMNLDSVIDAYQSAYDRFQGK